MTDFNLEPGDINEIKTIVEYMRDLRNDKTAPVSERIRASEWLKAVAADQREFLAKKAPVIADIMGDLMKDETASIELRRRAAEFIAEASMPKVAETEIMVLVEAEPNSDAVKFVNALNEGKYGETPVKPDENDVIANFTKAVDDIVSQTAKIGRPCGFAREYCQVILDQHFAKSAVDDIRDKLNGK